MRTVLLLRMAISMILPNCRSRLFLKPTLPGLMRYFVECFGAGRVIGEQLVANVMKVADQRRGDPSHAQAVADVGHGGGGFVAVDRDAHQSEPARAKAATWRVVALNIGGVGVGHGLNDDRRASANQNRPIAVADPNPNGRVAGERPAGFFRHRKAHRHSPFQVGAPTELIP